MATLDLAPPRPTLRQRLSRWDVRAAPYVYISPFFVLFALVGAFPLLFTGWVALHEWHLIRGAGDFVGLKNFTTVLQQEQFWRALRNTISIFLLSSGPQLVLAITIAALLDHHLRARTFWRMGVLLPYVVAPVAVTLIFGNLFAERYGLANYLLSTLRLEPVDWLNDVLPSHLAVATMVNFRYTGYNALIFLAAMQAIPRDYYEAAMIDGATRLRTFWSVTVPLLRPTIIFVVVTATIGGLQIFDEPRLYDPAGTGGPDRQFQTITLYLYQLGWTQRNFGRAAAVAWLLFLIIVLVAAVNFLLARLLASTGATATGPQRRPGGRSWQPR